MPNRTYVVAEIGVNHNGDLDLARRMVDAAAQSGADAAKFQTFQADSLVSKEAPSAPYARDRGGDNSQHALLRQLELSQEAFKVLAKHCRDLDLDFVSTPFDIDSARFLVETIGMPWIKVPSGEIVNGPLLLAVSRMGLPLVVSTGMATEAEILGALKVIAHGFSGSSTMPTPGASLSDADFTALRSKVTLLLCTSAYPTPYEQVNLRAMDRLARLTGGAVGLSDHTAGSIAAAAAVARGATIIEKHFTTDPNLPGPDQAASLNPDAFRRMVEDIRIVEAVLGSEQKCLQAAERENIGLVRQSLVALESIRQGESFTEKNLGTRRPGDGLSPMQYWSLLGQPANRDYQAGDLIRP